MALAAGTRLGPYEIIAPLGAGGMGEVYRARDTRLDRTVAIKTLPADLASDPERRQRLEREARAVAALSHPNICALYDVGEEAGTSYLVMELVEGTTLGDRLTRGPLALDEALACAIQIADALDKAHRNGIVHRDLKPGNIMIARPARQGPPQVKLLDFGLAKVVSDRPVLDDVQTATSPVTRDGQILGTLHYMSPEQLEGRAVDARSDVFAFGAVLFETLTGRRAFDGGNPASLIGSILHTTPPPVTALAPVAPPALDRLIAICLSKSPDDRWSSIHDVLLQLRAIADAPGGTAVAAGAEPRRHARLAWFVAAAASLAALVLASMLIARPREAAPVDLEPRVLAVLPEDGAPLVYGEAPEVSPDGRRVAFVARDTTGSTRLYVRELDQPHAQPLRGTEYAALPFWAPDSRRLGFFAQGQLRTIDTAGGPPAVLAAAPVPRGGTWNQDDVILFVAVPVSPPVYLPAAGGTPVPVATSSDARERRWFPRFLPDGRHYLYLTATAPGSERLIKVGSIDGPETMDLAPSNAPAVYADPGHLLFLRDRALVAQPFDPATRRLGGAPVVVAEGVGYNAITYQGLFSASSTGVLTYGIAAPGSRITWFDRDGRRLGPATPPSDQNSFCLTADESRIVYEAADPITGNVDLWAVSGSEDAPSRLTFAPPVDFFPVCSPDGLEVVFASLREGPPNLVRLSVDSPGSDQLILGSPVAKVPTHWTASGLVLFSILNAEFNWDIHSLSLADGSTAPVIATPAEERNAHLSPDGRFLAYMSNESGSFEIYVQPFGGGSGRWQVSRAGGLQPVWAPDGRGIYYLEPDSSLVYRPVTAGPSGLTFGEPTVLMVTNVTGWEPSNQTAQYAISRDGRRVLVSTMTGAPESIIIRLNWASGLAR